MRCVEAHEDAEAKTEEVLVHNIAGDRDVFNECPVGGMEIEILIRSSYSYNLIDDAILKPQTDFYFSSLLISHCSSIFWQLVQALGGLQNARSQRYHRFCFGMTFAHYC